MTEGIISPRVVAVFLITLALLLFGAGWATCYMVYDLRTPPQKVEQVVTVPESERFFVDARLTRVAGDNQYWEIRWIEYGLVRSVTVEGEAAKDRVVRWLGGV